MGFFQNLLRFVKLLLALAILLLFFRAIFWPSALDSAHPHALVSRLLPHVPRRSLTGAHLHKKRGNRDHGHDSRRPIF